MTSDNLKARRELYNGFGDTLARGIELVGTPTIFGLLGFVLDRILGTLPVITIIFVLFALVGMGIRMYYGYAAEMDEHQRQLPGRRASQPSPRPAGPVPAQPPLQKLSVRQALGYRKGSTRGGEPAASPHATSEDGRHA